METETEAVIHIQQEEEEMVVKFPCNLCNKEFSKKSSVYFHKLRMHCERQVCKICNKSLASKKTLRQHEKNMHEEPQFRCVTCEKQFAEKRCLLLHNKSCAQVSNKKDLKPCPVCHKKFSTQQSLLQHQHVKHTVPGAMSDTEVQEKELHNCKVCRKGFTTKKYLHVHMKNIHNAIQEEDRIVITKYNKDETVKEKIIILEGVQLTLPCPVCPQEFSTSNELLKHKKQQHEGEYVYTCMKCPARFTKNVGLIVHMCQTHREKTQLCEECPAKFKLNRQLLAHQRTRHPKSPRILRPQKSNSDVARCTLKRREREVIEKVKQQISTFPADSQRTILKSLIKSNPNILDTYQNNPLTNEDIREMIIDNSIPDLVMLNILTKLRKKWGVKIAMPNIRRHLIERKQVFEPYFKNEYISAEAETHFETKKGEAISRHLTYCTDVPGLVSILKKEIPDFSNDEYFIVIGVDGGKDNLKICLNWSKKGKDTNKKKLMGPKHSLVLASVCSVDETYENLKLLLDLIKADELEFKLSTDLKLVNIVIGKQTAASKFPCPYADCTRDTHGGWQKGPNMSKFSDLNSNYEKYCEHGGGNRKKLMNFKNQEFRPLLNSDSYILYVIPPPVKVVKSSF